MIFHDITKYHNTASSINVVKIYKYQVRSIPQAGIFLENKFRGSKSSLLKIEGGRTLIILKSILSLRHNSGGQNYFQGGQNVPFAPPPRKNPATS